MTQCKKVVLESLPEILGTQRARASAEQDDLARQFYDRIGCPEAELSWLNKKWDLFPEDRRELIEPWDAISVRLQCELLLLG